VYLESASAQTGIDGGPITCHRAAVKSNERHNPSPGGGGGTRRISPTWRSGWVCGRSRWRRFGTGNSQASRVEV